MTPYLTRQGDVLDNIAKTELGSETFCVDILEANPGLATQPLVLPMGLLIMLPDQPAKKATQSIRLWGKQ